MTPAQRRRVAALARTLRAASRRRLRPHRRQRRARSRTSAATSTSPRRIPRWRSTRLKPADGYEVSLFASEREFPELANPLAMTFDTRGRLWVLTSPTYPHVGPDETPNDKLIILEDGNGDGRADKVKVFADRLYIPTGFALGDGGVYVSQQPNLMFLQDTNGDDRADVRRVILHGFGTEDSHHSIHAYTWGPDGALYFQEGTFLHSQVETPYGPRPRRLRQRVPLRAAHREAERLRHVSVRQPLGPRHRWLGPELRQRRLERLQLLGHGVLRPRRLPEQAEADAGVDADPRPSDRRQRVRAQPALPGFRAGQLPVQQHHRVPGHQAVPHRRGRLGLRRRRGRAAAAVDRRELPPGGDAVRAGRRALRRRLVQPAGRPHAVLAARSAARQDARAGVAHHGQGPAAARAPGDPRRDDRRSSSTC